MERLNLEKLLNLVSHKNKYLITSRELEDFMVKTIKENELLKEELKELKDGIEGLFNNMNSLEIINKHELESDIEEI